MNDNTKALSLPAGWAHLPMPMFRRDPMPSEPGSPVHVTCHPSETRHPGAPEWSHVSLRLIEARGIFALRVEPWNLMSRPNQPVAVTLSPAEAEELSLYIVDLLECDAPIGLTLTVYGCPEIAEAPDRVHRSFVQVVGGRQADGVRYVMLTAYDKLSESSVKAFLSNDQARELANALWRAPQASATEDPA